MNTDKSPDWNSSVFIGAQSVAKHFCDFIRVDSCRFVDHPFSDIVTPMRKRHALATVLVVGGSMVLAYAQTTQPVQPAKDVLDTMLKPNGQTSARPLQPISNGPTIDKTTGAAAIAPGAQPINTLREGSYIVDRVGRLLKGSDNQGWEFAFEADGQALKDPPVVVLPNLKLMLMEDQIKETRRDLKFRITGMVTEYRGRNYVLLDKVVVVGD